MKWKLLAYVWYLCVHFYPFGAYFLFCENRYQSRIIYLCSYIIRPQRIILCWHLFLFQPVHFKETSFLVGLVFCILFFVDSNCCDFVCWFNLFQYLVFLFLHFLWYSILYMMQILNGKRDIRNYMFVGFGLMFFWQRKTVLYHFNVLCATSVYSFFASFLHLLFFCSTYT